MPRVQLVPPPLLPSSFAAETGSKVIPVVTATVSAAEKEESLWEMRRCEAGLSIALCLSSSLDLEE